MSKYQGDIADFPEEIVEWMLDERVRQGGDRSVEEFEITRYGGFGWARTMHDPEDVAEVISNKNFAHFYTHIKPKLKMMEPMQQLAELTEESLKQVKELKKKRPVYQPKKKSYKVIYSTCPLSDGRPVFPYVCMVIDLPVHMTAGQCFEEANNILRGRFDSRHFVFAITDFVPIA